jgi:hypothetical protein
MLNAYQYKQLVVRVFKPLPTIGPIIHHFPPKQGSKSRQIKIKKQLFDFQVNTT